MKLLSKLTLGALLVAVGGYASAADLLVKGTIIPPACELTLQNGGIVDYKKIDGDSLKPDKYTRLEAKSVPFLVKCKGGTRVGVKTIDNRAGSKVPGIVQASINPGYGDIYNYGLGTTSGGQRIGGYALIIKKSLANFPLVNTIVSGNNGLNWKRGDGALGQYQNIMSWSGFMATHPASVERVSGVLEVQAVINKTSELDIKEAVSLDGSATLELRYL
ncbi:MULTISPECIES: DUF1120 domain-containing protein [Pseudomonas]|uniref:DUF1120 domain-containing protein n=1 Tax=Pseudomonas TaxID=286 RepID=UPI00235EA9B7|nr:DUF1120 domain-containing protein [Pseudomonas asplenii]